MAIESARWSRDELERFPEDGNRYEVLDGELLVTPQPGFDHQFVAARLVHALYAYCAAHKIGVVVGPGAVIWGKNELQPDVEVIPVSPPPRKRTWATLPFPILAVEILSPSGVSRARDLGVKREAYLQRGGRDVLGAGSGRALRAYLVGRYRRRDRRFDCAALASEARGRAVRDHNRPALRPLGRLNST